MSVLFSILSLLIGLSVNMSPDFKTSQIAFSRVKAAYDEKFELMNTLLTSKNIKAEEIELYIRIFKLDKIIEVWGKNKSDTMYQLIKEFDICALSGKAGPKRKEGDFQVPEGFYYINHFNPQSNFHLSLGINYPNKSDRIFADKNQPGSAIYIHGNCVTIGCIPITDDKIKELYILAVEAKNNGQTKIPVTIFPAKMTSQRLNELKSANFNLTGEVLLLWDELEKAYQVFNFNKKPIKVIIDGNGRHKIN